VPPGYQYDAENNSKTTHRLPIPPNSKGESKYQVILTQMMGFMGGDTDYPMLFTSTENIPMMTSFIQTFTNFGENDVISRYRIYPVHRYFLEMMEAAGKNSAEETAEDYFRRDHKIYPANM